MTELPPIVLHDLLNKIAHQDAGSFDRLYRHYHPQVFAFVMHLYAQRADAEEITDDVFLSLARKPQAYGAASSFTTWLLGVAKHKVVDFLRKQGRQVPTELLDDEAWCRLPDASGDVTTQAVEHEQTLAIERCREQLPVEQKEALFWVYYTGAGVAEIATQMQCPIGTVKSRLFSAREKMHRCLERWNKGLTP